MLFLFYLNYKKETINFESNDKYFALKKEYLIVVPSIIVAAISVAGTNTSIFVRMGFNLCCFASGLIILFYIVVKNLKYFYFLLLFFITLFFIISACIVWRVHIFPFSYKDVANVTHSSYLKGIKIKNDHANLIDNLAINLKNTALILKKIACWGMQMFLGLSV